MCTINICKTSREQIPRCWSSGSIDFSVFDSTNWPSKYLPGDGEEHIKEVIKHYQPIVQHQATLAKWQSFLNVVQAKVYLKGKDSQQLLTALVQHPSMQHIFPNLCKLAVIALVIPMSSADCPTLYCFCSFSRLGNLSFALFFVCRHLLLRTKLFLTVCAVCQSTAFSFVLCSPSFALLGLSSVKHHCGYINSLCFDSCC